MLSLPTRAAELYCLSEGAVNWTNGTPETLLPAEGDQGDKGWFEFWIETDSGSWRGRHIGSRALYDSGGSFRVISDGTGSRAHWVGIEESGGFEGLRIDLGSAALPFLRIRRDTFVELGTCAPVAGRTFFDGEEVVR